MDLDIKGDVDAHIDDYHEAEDIGITLSQAVAKSVGDNKYSPSGINDSSVTPAEQYETFR